MLCYIYWQPPRLALSASKSVGCGGDRKRARKEKKKAAVVFAIGFAMSRSFIFSYMSYDSCIKLITSIIFIIMFD